ncbi:MAG: hypothetical protein AB4206_03060 [Xenococcaceae cyanobacterium]
MTSPKAISLSVPASLIALQNLQDATVKKSAKRAMTMLRCIAADLPSNADLVSICNQLPDLVGQVF